ncbi:MAG: Gfo/Idh/MocA family protein [Candidatus Limnocylindria bacterium]
MKLAFIGTGGIATWHLDGLVELLEGAAPAAPEGFELVAVADPRQAVADVLADQARDRLGTRPTVYTDYREVIERESLDAASVLVPHHLHWSIARDCLDAGLHLQLQKPIALTIAEGHRIIEHAASRQRSIVVSEPSILGRETRAIITALRDGALVGPPTFLMDHAVTTLKGGFFANTPWRHLKGMAGAGWFVDHGVHRANWFLEVFGSVASVQGVAAMLEPVRGDVEHGTFDVDTEDCAMAILRFAGGVLGSWLVASAGHGAAHNLVRVYGPAEVADVDAGFVQRDEGPPVGLYQAIEPFLDEHVPRHPIAHSFAELADLASNGVQPIGSAGRALEALAIVYACLEAAGRDTAVAVADVLSGAAHTYEDSIVAARSRLASHNPARLS